MARITASALTRLANCPASAALPQARSESEYSTRGTAIHAFLQRVQEVGRDEALEGVADEYREICEAIDTDALPVDGNYAAEVAFAYDLIADTARELGRGGDRDYSGAEDDEITGTVDVVGVTDDAAIVFDFKTGWSTIPHPERNEQLKFYALAAARAYGKERAEAHVVIVRPDEEPLYLSAEFSEFDLAVFSAALSEIARRVDALREAVARGEIPSVSEGEWCRYCPAAPCCPAKVALARTLSGSALEKIEDLVGELTPANAGTAYRRAEQIIALGQLVRDRVKEMARTRPIPLGDGKFLGEQWADGKEKLDSDATYQAIRALYGDEVAEAAAPAKRVALKKTLKEAGRLARKTKKAKSAAEFEREVLDVLRESGAATSSRYLRVGEIEAAECVTEGCAERAMSDGGVCDLCAYEAQEAIDV